MKRFVVTLTILVTLLFVVVSGVDSTLAHIAKAGNQSSFVAYDEKGKATVAYTGDLSQCVAYSSDSGATSTTLHRVAPASHKLRWL